MPRRIAFALFRQDVARLCSGLREESGLFHVGRFHGDAAALGCCSALSRPL